MASLIDLSLMSNPFDEISHPGHKESVKKLVNRTAADKILRIEGDTEWTIRAFPADAVDPFDVIRVMHAAEDKVEATLVPYTEKLCELFDRVDEKRFNALVNHILPKEKKLRCGVCDKTLKKDATKLIEHIIGGPHVEKLREFNYSYPLEALAFWTHTLRMAQKDAPWFPNDKKRNRDKDNMYKKVDVKKIKAARNKKIVESNPSFREAELMKGLTELYKKKAESAEIVKEFARKQNIPLPQVDSETPRAFTLFDVLALNVSLIKNPFDEFAHPGGADVAKELVYRTAAKRILRFEQNRLYPMEGIDPLDILRPIPSQKGQVEDAVTPYMQLMRHLFYGEPKGIFNILVTHLLVENKTYTCELCSCCISNEVSHSFPSSRAVPSPFRSDGERFPLITLVSTNGYGRKESPSKPDLSPCDGYDLLRCSASQSLGSMTLVQDIQVWRTRVRRRS